MWWATACDVGEGGGGGRGREGEGEGGEGEGEKVTYVKSNRHIHHNTYTAA